jgi:hypothetical protein
MPSNFISYSDFIGANADQIKAMEDRLRAAEQESLREAKGAMDPAGDEIKKRAFWGEAEGEGLTSYGDWVAAKEKIEAAKQYQADIQNDAGQLNQLRKLGGAYGSLDAELVFGANRADNKGPRVSLGEFMGYDAKELGELAASTEGEAQSFAERRAKEQSARDELDAKGRTYKSWQAGEAQRRKEFDDQTLSLWQRNATGSGMNADPYFAGLWQKYSESKDPELRGAMSNDARIEMAKKGLIPSEFGSYEQWSAKNYGAAPEWSAGYVGPMQTSRADWERENPNKNPWDADFYGDRKKGVW